MSPVILQRDRPNRGLSKSLVSHIVSREARVQETANGVSDDMGVRKGSLAINKNSPLCDTPVAVSLHSLDQVQIKGEGGSEGEHFARLRERMFYATDSWLKTSARSLSRSEIAFAPRRSSANLQWRFHYGTDERS